MAPPWERRWPGLQEYELEQLRAAGATGLEIDPAAAAEDRLVLKFNWPRPDGHASIRLIAQYPDTFPDLRPNIFAPDLPGGRHVNPRDGGVCLIGRGTHNWPANMTLAGLLQLQLEAAIAANADPEAARREGIEEREGVPAEEVWHAIALPDSYCLIDSEWAVDPVKDHGLIHVRFRMRGDVPQPVILSAVERICASDGETLRSWTQALPPDLQAAATITIPWVRLQKAPLPDRTFDGTFGTKTIERLIASVPAWTKSRRPVVSSARGWRLFFYAFLYPSELEYATERDGWLFVVLFERQRTKKKSQRFGPFPLRTLRAGANDLGRRVPSVAALRNKRVLLIGTGAIGASVALDLARNGCAELRLIDHDIVDPGNGIRWPLGAATWGKLKVKALAEHIALHYPATTVVPFMMHFGMPIPPDARPLPEFREETILRQAFDGADLVIDMTAEQGINWLLDDRCREKSIPFITGHASPSLEGGYVARVQYGIGSGCRICVEHAWKSGAIPVPRGMPRSRDDVTAAALQAPGCADLTFPGAGFDLAEISLQTVRLAVDTLSDAPQYPPGSCVHVLSFVDDSGRRTPPKWFAFSLDKQQECQNQH